ncbi:MAG TPA: TIGR00730 family Rossman fold protein [Ktedonobacterales bacterium]
MSNDEAAGNDTGGDADERALMRTGMHDNASWRVFTIMSEFVQGFNFLARFDHSVTFFGSARMKDTDPYYVQARELAKRLAGKGYSIVTGGGPGIMAAANHGALDADGTSVGINIQLPHEQRINRFVRDYVTLKYFFSRKVMLDFSAEAYVFFPGGYGTMDEYFELLTLIQTGKVEHGVPVVMVGTAFWSPLVTWMRTQMLEKLSAINPPDLDLFILTDDLDVAVAAIDEGMASVHADRAKTRGHTHLSPEEKIGQATRPMAGTEQ